MYHHFRIVLLILPAFHGRFTLLLPLQEQKLLQWRFGQLFHDNYIMLLFVWFNIVFVNILIGLTFSGTASSMTNGELASEDSELRHTSITTVKRRSRSIHLP